MINSLFTYSLTSGVTLASMYAAYRIFMRQTTLFHFNRSCILAIYCIAALAPLLTFSLPTTHGSMASFTAVLDEISINVSHAAAIARQSAIAQSILTIYIIGAAIVALRFVADFAYMIYLRTSCKATEINGRTVRILTGDNRSPFSWGGEIFIPKTYLDESLERLAMVISHEAAHCSSRHWIDLLLSHMVIAVNWYNPAAWLLNRELVNAHEYQADGNVLKSTDDATEYQLLLIEKTAGPRFHALADSLNHSSLKKRITMMMKNQSKRSAYLRSLALLPALAAAMCVTNSSCANSVQEQLDDQVRTEISTSRGTTAATQQTDASIEANAQYPGGFEQLYADISDVLQWKDGLDEGRMSLELSIDAEGNLAEITVREGLSETTDSYVIGCLKKLTAKWTPAKDSDGNCVGMSFVLPVTLKTK